ncbi:MAG: metallophosphoesterase, partial [Gaiellaceae bacterium]
YHHALATEQVAAHFTAGRATWFDAEAPRVELLNPSGDAPLDQATLIVSGRAGQDVGDLDSVEVELVAAADSEGPPTVTASVVPDSSGGWAVEIPKELAPGEYVARATQRDAAGNAGIAVSERFAVADTAALDTEAVLLAAGDIAGCGGSKHNATFALIEQHPEATVAALGDLAYEDGSQEEFAECYAPSWGQALERTRPALGNHEYGTEDAVGYFDFFADTLVELGPDASDPGRGWYSYDLGSWHVVVLNSNCADVVGGCGSGSPQDEWLRADLADSEARCTLAYWHHPRFSSSTVHPPGVEMSALWETLDQAGVELALTGHHHGYERFAPQGADGTLEPETGVSQFIVGTGGRGSYQSSTVLSPNSAVRASDTYGVLKLSLGEGSYHWEFLAAEGSTFTDSGSRRCHD